MTTKTRKATAVPKTISIAVDLGEDGWAALVDRPEDIHPDHLFSMSRASRTFCNLRSARKFQTMNISYALFILVMSSRYRSFSAYGSGSQEWFVLSIEERREVYREVGLALGYDF